MIKQREMFAVERGMLAQLTFVSGHPTPPATLPFRKMSRRRDTALQLTHT